MAAVSAAQTTTTTLTPPSSSHGQTQASNWVHDDQQENGFDFKMNTDHHDTPTSTNGTFTSGAQMATRRMKSADNLSGDRWHDSGDNSTLLPPYQPEPQNGRASPAGWRSHSPHKNKVEGVPTHGLTEEESKWIHRDKLAKIESQELQAAGLFVPRSRAPSKQSRRDRSRSQMRSEPSRSRKNSTTAEQRALEIQVPSWDLRTPEEIAEEEANAYFTSNGLKGSSRIPVAKASPAPISLDYMDRGSPATGRQSESPEGDPSMASKRSRSASASLRGPDKPNSSGMFAAGKRTNTEISPKKGPPSSRKMSSGAKSAVNQRPKTRSGSSGTRPSTRSGESPPSKQPEGDPPWMINSYKPDPRLPPDQQLLPTVARRLQQEQWEKSGTYGDVYDKDFRPLNDKALPQQPETEKPAQAEETPSQDFLSPNGEWPLRPEAAAKSPSLRQGSYSTMPKISDKPATSPMASPRQPNTPQMFQPSIEPQSPAAQRAPDEKEDEKKKGGCGCCIVM